MSDDKASGIAARTRKLRALPVRDWFVLGYACLLMPVVWVGLRSFGLPRTLAWAVAPRAGEQINDSRVQYQAALGRLVNIAARYGPIRAACLVRSLVLLRILSARGVTGTLQIGVRKGASSQLDAHAWVEYEGIPVNDHPNIANDFAVFDALDTSVAGALL